jgi:hypothetical protein
VVVAVRRRRAPGAAEMERDVEVGGLAHQTSLAVTWT